MSAGGRKMPLKLQARAINVAALVKNLKPIPPHFIPFSFSSTYTTLPDLGGQETQGTE